MFERRKAKLALEEKLNAIQMNLENNYKDLTIQSWKEAQELFETYQKGGILKAADLAAFSKRLTEYGRKLEKYGHADISSFLKERY